MNVTRNPVGLPLWLGLATLATACSSSAPGRGPRATILPTAVVELPTDHVSGLFLVSTWVDGKGPYSCLLDTGTDRMLLDVALAHELGHADSEESGRVRGAAGTEMPFHGQFEIANLRLGAAEFRGVSAGMVDLTPLGESLGRPIHGILGCDLFLACVLQLDYPHRTAQVLQQVPAMPAGAAFHFAETVPWIEAEVAGRPMHLLLDTGFQRTLSVTPDLDLPWRRQPHRDGEVVTVTGPEPKAQGRLQGLVRAGDLVLTNPIVTVAAGSLKLGADALRRVVVTLDMQHGRVLLQVP